MDELSCTIMAPSEPQRLHRAGPSPRKTPSAPQDTLGRGSCTERPAGLPAVGASRWPRARAYAKDPQAHVPPGMQWGLGRPGTPRAWSAPHMEGPRAHSPSSPRRTPVPLSAPLNSPSAHGGGTDEPCPPCPGQPQLLPRGASGHQVPRISKDTTCQSPTNQGPGDRHLLRVGEWT